MISISSALAYARLIALVYVIALTVYALWLPSRHVRLHAAIVLVYWLATLTIGILNEFVSRELGREMVAWFGWSATTLVGIGLTVSLRDNQRHSRRKEDRN